MQILEKPIKKTDLLKCVNLIDAMDGLMVKAADIEHGTLGIDSELHADIEQSFIANGSNQDNIWGFNLYPEKDSDDFIEYDSMINIRPRQHNRSRSVENPEIRAKITEIVNRWVK